MSKIKSLPGQRLCSSLPPDRVPWETSDAIPRNGHRKVAPQPPAPSRRWSWRCTSTRQGTIFIFPASRTLGGPTCSGSFSSPASARPRRRRTCFTSTISMIRIVPCCCPSRRGRAKAAFGPFAGAGGYPQGTARPSGQREVRQEAFRIAGSFSGRAFRAHQADGQDRRERGLQPRYG